MDLPPEIEEQYLMDLDVDDVLSYCQTNTRAQEICNSLSFWDQKSIRDLGFPISLLCQQSYYWQYKLIEQMLGSSALFGMLVRAGKFELARKYLDENDFDDIIEEAILADDVASLRFMESYIREEAEKDEYFTKNHFFIWLRLAFLSGSARAVQYLVSLDPGIMIDNIILENLFLNIGTSRPHKGLRLLEPYVRQYLLKYPEILNDPNVGGTFRNYLLSLLQ